MTTDTLRQVWLQDARAADLASWLIDAAIVGQPQLAILEAYCEKLVEMGVPLMRVHVTQTALHPVYGGVGFDWHQTQAPVRHEYAHTEEAPENWLVSPFFHMMSNGLSVYRERIGDATAPSRFPVLNEMRALGATDYLALARLFDDSEDGEPVGLDDRREGAIVSWMSQAPDGFSEADILLIRATFPSLCLTLKSGTHQQTAEDLLGIYLGRDAGRRVLSGEIQRGSSRWIDAVICYFDLEGFTSMSRRIEGEALIAMLNDYFGLVVTRIEEHGGNVLKFMGDGLLAIFDRELLSDASDRALRMATALDDEMAGHSSARSAKGLPILGYTMALHAGRVLYGNIGADERLDFTVIGPEVNLAARLADMHRPLGQHVIVSETLAHDVKDPPVDLVSLGRYMLRGVDQPQELFTIYKG